MTPDEKPSRPPGSGLTNLPSFLETAITGTEPPWCVDGRPDPQKDKGPQMLGGSLHPVVLKAIWENQPFNQLFAAENLNALKNTGFALGVHWGSHKHEGTSDCGFADYLPKIIAKAQEQQYEIIRRLLAVYQQNQAVFNQIGLSQEQFITMLNQAYQKINAFLNTQVEIKGEALISLAETLGAQVENLEGDHQEQAAFVNLKKGVTLNTNLLNEQGRQAFNLDLGSAIHQAGALGVPDDFAIAASLILYQATEMVLVEDRQKPSLPVVVHS